jgi:tetratricopeptide (TPR) repeat protein
MGRKTMKILLTCIFKDDSEYTDIKQMLTSFMPYMAGLCVVISGRKKNTTKIKELITQYKGHYLQISPITHPKVYIDGQFSNFAEARNICFGEASKLQKKDHYDWWIWADSDDILLNGQELLEVAEKASKYEMDTVFFTYWYSINLKNDSFSEKDVQIHHLRERLLKPNMFKWVSRLHEIALPLDDNFKPKITTYDYNPKENRNLVWAHLTTPDKTMQSMKRNVRILEAQIKEEEHKDPRTVFYLAKSYFDLANMSDKKELLQLSDLLLDDYLEKSGWAEERSNAWEYKGNIRATTGNHRAAIECYHKAIQEYGNRNMPYLLLAKEYAAVDDTEQAEFWLDLSLKMDVQGTRTTIGNPMEVKYLAAQLKFNSCIKKQDIDGAINWLKIKNEMLGVKDDQMLVDLEDAKLLNQAAMWVFNYSKWLKEKGHTDKIPYVLQSLPIELGREVFAHVMANDYAQPRVWGEKEIAYYASWGTEHFEPWSGKSLTSGIGGSETAVIELAKRWVKLGYKVTVYGDPREDEGEIDGVIYRPWYEINWNDAFNILIYWRSPHLLDRPVKAKKIFMDLHDIVSQLDWTEPRMNRVDKVFFKSKFQRSMLPKLPDEKARIISNGI